VVVIIVIAAAILAIGQYTLQRPPAPPIGQDDAAKAASRAMTFTPPKGAQP
jgi:hypothetical protein